VIIFTDKTRQHNEEIEIFLPKLEIILNRTGNGASNEEICSKVGVSQQPF
tara:strand:+ start:1069 stop:1218 length:150 start_codon:yes stop_codon:yes gene_type:complete